MTNWFFLFLLSSVLGIGVYEKMEIDEKEINGGFVEDLDLRAEIDRMRHLTMKERYYVSRSLYLSYRDLIPISYHEYRESVDVFERVLHRTSNDVFLERYEFCKEMVDVSKNKSREVEEMFHSMEDHAFSCRYTPIEPLSESVYEYMFEGVKSLQERYFFLKTSDDRGLIESAHKRNFRVFSIETGSLEGVYEVDHDITKSLVSGGFFEEVLGSKEYQQFVLLNSKNIYSIDQILRIMKEQYDMLEFIDEKIVRQEYHITEDFVLDLHRSLTSTATFQEIHVKEHDYWMKKLVLIERGKYKVYPNFPTTKDGLIVEYCPPSLVEREMERFFECVGSLEMESVNPVVFAAYVHCSLVSIHPFSDGNGRVARYLASFILMKNGLFPFVVKKEEREKYYRSVRMAKEGDLRPMVLFIVYQQEEYLSSLENSLTMEREEEYFDL